MILMKKVKKKNKYLNHSLNRKYNFENKFNLCYNNDDDKFGHCFKK